MTLSLKTKVTLVITGIVLIVSAISTALSISASRRSIERELIGRGTALAEALARAVDEGLAAENLNLMHHVEEIVHTRDVVLTQVFSTLWLAVASVPVGELNTPADENAGDFFRRNPDEHASYVVRNRDTIDVYHSIVLDSHDSRVPRVLIGFVRLRLTTAGVDQAVRRAVVMNILSAGLLTIVAVIALHTLMGRYVLRPLFSLQTAIAHHRHGEFPEAVPVNSGDELGALSREFNAMSAALKEREEKLAEEKERLAVTVRSIGDAVIVTDTQGRITLFNKVAEQHTGWSAADAAGRNLSEVFHIIGEKTRERCDNPVARVISTGIICGLANHTVLIKKDGSEISIEDSAAPIRDRTSAIVGVVLVFRDVTEKHRIENELIKAEKLQSVGVLAGGLAHDFNNLLTSIVGNISMAKMYIDSRSRAFTRLVEAETASRRATDLTYQLLTFAKGGAPVRTASSVTDLLRECASFTLSGTSVAAQYEFDDELWNADIDAGQISQVFNNLIINATQAMPGGGRITFTAKNAELGENEVPTLRPGTYVHISVADSGTGIPEDILPRIFDPYFTTKQKGSGLGLATAYSIITRHDGRITVESLPGRGATFHVYLPASHRLPPAAAAGEPGIRNGRGKILVMDDERLIREVSGEMLRTLGYTVAVAVNGAECMELYRKAAEAGEPFDVVIMDLTVPGGQGGKETVQEMLAFDPQAKVVVSSGYSNDVVMADYGRFGFKGVITKPYSIEAFSKTLNRVLKA